MRNLATSGLFVAALATTGVATAAGVPVQIDSFKYGYAQSSPLVNLSGGYFGVTGNVDAGELKGKLNGASFTTYCTELQYAAPWGQSNDYEIIGGATQWGSTKSTDLDRLFTNHYGSVVDVQTSQAMQIAVWEILYETGTYNVASGNIAFASVASDGNASAGAIALANTWLGSLGSLGANYTHIDALVNPVGQEPGKQAQYQNYMVMTPVPEPEGYALAFAGLACIGLFGRKFRAAKKA